LTDGRRIKRKGLELASEAVPSTVVTTTTKDQTQLVHNH
jgi:hypothetical protein